jgi:hypothetical protein
MAETKELTRLVYCPQPTCHGHRFTEAQLKAERKALRPYLTEPATRVRSYYDPDAPPCFRVHDAERKRAAEALSDGRRRESSHV